MRASIIALAALAATPAFAGAAIAAMLAATAAIAGADPDKKRFADCMAAQSAATNMAGATNGPEVWPLWAKVGKEECEQLVARMLDAGYKRCLKDGRCK
jgi:hypothetical protein